MTSHQAFIIITIGILCVVSLLPVQSHELKVDSVDESHKVKLSVYYEALCPYCAKFIVNSLANVFENGLISIIDLKLIPWGNAYLKDKNTWICQHGPDECLLNTVEACAIRASPDLGSHFSFKFIKCVERMHLEDQHGDWQSCFTKERLSPKPVLDCYNSGLGFQAERSYADETNRLSPPHRFVPWIVVDNFALQEDYQNFVSYVCRAYRGPRTPKACSSPQVHINSFDNATDTAQVCYKQT